MNSRNKKAVWIVLSSGNIFNYNPELITSYCLGRKYRWESLQSKYDFHKKAWIITRKKKVVFVIPLTEKQADIVEFNIGYAAKMVLLNEV